MTRFLDGPAAGVNLMLRRSPLFLRVTDDGQDLDALDQIDDTPRPNERLYAYVMQQYLGAMHLLVRGKDAAKRGGFFTRADYRYLEMQPDDADMRSNSRWHDWTEANRALIPEHIASRVTAIRHKEPDEKS
jgi:hypothetical protein